MDTGQPTASALPDEPDASGEVAQFRSTLFKAMDQAVIVSDLAGRVRFWNAAAEQMYGWTAVEITGELVSRLVPPGSVDQVQAMRATVLSGGTWKGDFEMARQDGTTFPALVTGVPMLNSAGAVTGIIGLSRDLTERKEAEQAAQTFLAVITSSADAVFTKRLDGIILTWNRGAERLYGYLAADVIGRHVDLLDPQHAGVEIQYLLRVLSAGESVLGLETVRRRRDGAMLDVSLTISPIFNELDEVIAASVIGRDISDRKRLERQLAAQSTYDDVTGLPNRALLDDRLALGLARSVRRGRPLAVLFVDIDRFNAINARHGYVVGDQVLAEVAARLHATAGLGDTVARFGGDEFVVLSDETSKGEVADLAERIGAILAEPMDISGVQLTISASLGIAVSPPLAPDDDALLRYAQAAMYHAKSLGRGRWQVFDTSNEQRWNERIELGRELSEAVTKNGLKVHYQPVVELVTGRLLGIEALLRWDHPTRGWVPPALFVPLAEDTGLIAALDDWVLRRACRDAAALRREGSLPEKAYLAVNVSARNVSDPALVARVRDAAEVGGIPLAALELEVTETGLLADARSARRVLRSLRDLGVGVALDDFGTGYSSLTYLRQLPISTLKVDREFVQHIATRADDLAIAISVVDLGRAVGLRTVAEGVETPEQLAILHRMGCQAGQGYLWSPALPVGELATLLGAQDGFTVASATGAFKRTGRSRPEPVTNQHGLHRITRLHGEGASLATIAAALNAEQFQSPTDQRWHPASVARVIADVAYRTQRNKQPLEA
ncbi:MAG: diguanylate cyclase/phosphodiesterase with sensor(s) [Frankiales bacterium]|nr:diguanylate cyclase/phosphodiesterase with sensor(s) [Frankiales bacterium]